jgi:sugar/nucleoside kinase (ribokinase family)
MEKSILIYESMDELKLNSYSNEIVQFLSLLSPLPHYFHIDSFSDPSNFQYAIRLLQEQNPLVILIFDHSKNVKGLSALLQAIMEKKDIKIMTLNECELLRKIQKRSPYEKFDNYPELINAMDNWI